MKDITIYSDGRVVSVDQSQSIEQEKVLRFKIAKLIGFCEFCGIQIWSSENQGLGKGCKFAFVGF